MTEQPSLQSDLDSFIPTLQRGNKEEILLLKLRIMRHLDKVEAENALEFHKRKQYEQAYYALRKEVKNLIKSAKAILNNSNL